MPDTLLDSYSESNQNNSLDMCNGVGVLNQYAGESFKPSLSYKITRNKFYLKKGGSPTGNAVARLYAHSGTYGTSSIPTGAALGTSDNFDVSTLTTSYQLIEFTFSGAAQYVMTATTAYVIELDVSGISGDGSNKVIVGYADPNSDDGNMNYSDTLPSTARAAGMCFYVYGDVANVSVTSPLATINIQGLVPTLKVFVTSPIANLNIQGLVPTIRITGAVIYNLAKSATSSMTNLTKHASSAVNQAKSAVSTWVNQTKN